MSHLRQVHHYEDTTLSCPVDECKALYLNVNSLCSHIYRKHKNLPASSVHVESPNESEQESPSSVIFDVSIPVSISHDVNQLLHRDVYEQKKKSSMFLLQLKEERLLLSMMLLLVLKMCSSILSVIFQKLALSGIDISDIDGLSNVFDEISNPFMGLTLSTGQVHIAGIELHCK